MDTWTPPPPSTTRLREVYGDRWSELSHYTQCVETTLVCGQDIASIARILETTVINLRVYP